MTLRVLFRPTLLCLALLCSFSLASCRTDEDAECSARPATLSGYWQLTDLQCFCAPGAAIPDEAIAFDDAGKVTFYQNGQATGSSTYQLSTGTFTCADGTVTLLSIDKSPGNLVASVAVSACELVIDQGSCFDAPRKTYRRVLR